MRHFPGGNKEIVGTALLGVLFLIQIVKPLRLTFRKIVQPTLAIRLLALPFFAIAIRRY